MLGQHHRAAYLEHGGEEGLVQFYFEVGIVVEVLDVVETGELEAGIGVFA